MVSYTGIQRSPNQQDGFGDAYPITNPHQNYRSPVQRTRVVFSVVLQPGAAQAAIGTDDYTFTILDRARRALVVDSCWVIDPDGIAPSGTVYNTYQVYNGAVKMCEQTSVYGVVSNEPFEISRANTVANRTLAAGDAVTLKITGTSTGKPIALGTRVFLVCSYA